jgi:hypothetical protein
MGWEATERAAYDERAKRITLLRAQLSEIDPAIDRLA